jgi:hypothetical protein
MNVGYFSVQHRDRNTILDWDLLGRQMTVSKGQFVTRVQFSDTLSVKMDGKKRIAVITWK